MRIAVAGKDGKSAGVAVLVYEGDGKRMNVELKYTPNAITQAGGFENMSLTFSKPVKNKTGKAEFEFKKTAGK